MNFGHTVPQFILPYGAITEINPANKTVSILENTVIKSK
jgi:muramoyltetrapeptide carboxypeptidase LdcA involved in peptidoglycan recycling